MPLFILTIICALIITTFAGITPSTDFISLYLPLRAWVSGYALYGEGTHLPVIAELRAQSLSAIPALAPAYPPYSYIMLSFLGFFNATSSSRIWFFLNLLLLAGTVFLLSTGCSRRERLLCLLLTICFMPTIAVISLGQFSMVPVFGVALLIWAIDRSKSWGIALSLPLLIFKPHLGIFPFVSTLGWLCGRAKLDRTSKSAILALALTALIPFTAGLHIWFDYFQSLARFQSQAQIGMCDTCSSMYVTIGRIEMLPIARFWNFGAVLTIVTALLLFLAGVKLARNRRPILRLILNSTLLTLIISPYVRNYDFVILLPAFIICFACLRATHDRVVLFLTYITCSIPPLLLLRGEEVDLIWISAAALLAISTKISDSLPGKIIIVEQSRDLAVF